METLNNALKQICCNLEDTFFSRKNRHISFKQPFKNFMKIRNLKFLDNSAEFYLVFEPNLEIVQDFDEPVKTGHHIFVFAKHLYFVC